MKKQEEKTLQNCCLGQWVRLDPPHARTSLRDGRPQYQEDSATWFMTSPKSTTTPPLPTRTCSLRNTTFTSWEIVDSIEVSTGVAGSVRPGYVNHHQQCNREPQPARDHLERLWMLSESIVWLSSKCHRKHFAHTARQPACGSRSLAFLTAAHHRILSACSEIGNSSSTDCWPGMSRFAFIHRDGPDWHPSNERPTLRTVKKQRPMDGEPDVSLKEQGAPDCPHDRSGREPAMVSLRRLK